ncbi:MAG: class I tRNA ligase family protein [Nanoarchaeota archaeon]
MAKQGYFQISTAIDYPSARFHLGHGYEKICADVIARWNRIIGLKVHFSTGTDCHGLKIERAAKSNNKTPLKFVTEISGGFKELCKELNISYDDFIMTIEPRHEKVAQYVLNKLNKNGDIYKGHYDGPYCVDCETYYTEKDLIDKKCPVHKNVLDNIKEDSYFFKLSKYQDFLIDYINKNPDCIWPDKKRKEILNRLKEPLTDLSISRKEVKWGIPLPFDKTLTEFVWVEALNNYLTTIDYPNKDYKNYWPATHIIGPDIVWHHTAIWFSILKSLELDMPKVIVHGFINLKGQKLSKAANIIIDPIELSKKYSADALRYYLIREIPFGQDGDFSEEALKNRINNELANDLGNLISRVLTICEKNFDGKIKKHSIEKNLEDSLKLDGIKELMESYDLTNAINEIWAFVKVCNKHINDEKLWEIQKEEQEKHLYSLLESIRIISLLLSPFIPETSSKIYMQLGVSCNSIKEAKFELIKEYMVKKGPILFQKVK